MPLSCASTPTSAALNAATAPSGSIPQRQRGTGPRWKACASTDSFSSVSVRWPGRCRHSSALLHCSAVEKKNVKVEDCDLKDLTRCSLLLIGKRSQRSGPAPWPDGVRVEPRELQRRKPQTDGSDEAICCLAVAWSLEVDKDEERERSPSKKRVALLSQACGEEIGATHAEQQDPGAAHGRAHGCGHLHQPHAGQEPHRPRRLSQEQHGPAQQGPSESGAATGGHGASAAREAHRAVREQRRS
eukprot:scaffold3808_cov222-Pinguiococcus_pyrenoidosus.AAC.3